jgi:hypothetical protein
MTRDASADPGGSPTPLMSPADLLELRMAMIAIIGGGIWCLAAILGSLAAVSRLQGSRRLLRRLLPIIGFFIGLAGLVVIVDSVQQSAAMPPGAGDRAHTPRECREMTFSGWSAWRPCESSDE